MKTIVLVSTLLFSVHASALVEWVDRYANCEIIFDAKPRLTDLGPQIENHLSDKVVSKWGRTVVAFPGSNDGKPGLWILQDGGASKISYFAPLPKARIIKDDDDGSLSTEWDIKTDIVDRPPLYIQILKPAGTPMSVDISSRNKHDYEADEDYNHDDEVDEFAPTPRNVHFEPAVSPDARDQFLDILVKRVSNVLPKQKDAQSFVDRLKQCKDQLKADDKDDKRLVDAIENAIHKYNSVPHADPTDPSGARIIKERGA
jgi:hypothetical protein